MVRCRVCNEPIRPEDDFTRDDRGRFVHADCWEPELVPTSQWV